jgi:tetratricopeptide (TPR) repeat protein
MWLVLCALSLAGALVDVGEVEISQAPEEAVAQAAALLQKGQFTEAGELYHALAEANGGPEARYWEALCRYESGELRAARAASELALAGLPGNLSVQNLHGLILVESGDVSSGIVELEAVLERAKAKADTAVEARVLVNLGMAQLERGAADQARRLTEEGLKLAKTLGDSYVQAAATDTLAAIDALSGKDPGVGQKLGKGDIKGARAEAESYLARATSYREKIDAAILMAAVERSEGRLESAISRLTEAASTARSAGLVREQAMALGQLGIVQSVAGRHALAADALTAGVELAHSGGYRVTEVDLRCELGIVLMRLDQVGAAKAQSQAAGALLGSMQYPQGMARQAELGGMIAAAEGDLATATAALARAISYAESQGRALDGARAATSLAGALEATAPAEADRWGAKAEALFTAAGDPLGPAHVYMARGIAAAKAKKLDSALSWFGKAADYAKKTGGARAELIERTAREDAAQTLVLLGQSEDVAKRAAEAGLTELVARQQGLQEAFDAYDAGLSAYQAKNWAEAKKHFSASRQLFEKVQEPLYARRARVAAAWAVYNDLLSRQNVVAEWDALVTEAASLEEPELLVRSYGAAVLAAVDAGQSGLTVRLEECVRKAENNGFPDVASRCHAALAEGEGELKDRAEHARLAFGQNPAEAVGVYALYTVAVDAYNAGEVKLALELAKLARGKAVKLAGPLDELLRKIEG